MSLLVAILTDLVAIVVLSYVLYFRRHRRRDLMLSYVAMNLGVLVISAALSDGSAGIGLGLGLFGILSIIRLRSDQITQSEIAYYFVALAIGLLAGLHPDGWWPAPAGTAVLVAAMYLADHPRWCAGNRRQVITLDHAELNEQRLETELSKVLGARVQRVEVLETDLVRDITVVDVRYRIGGHQQPAAPTRLVSPDVLATARW